MRKEQQAASYARSSKDRSEISIQAQSTALEQLASSRSLSIVERFEDVVVSGATEDRPGFQALAQAIKDPARTWSHLLVYDTSRIARGRHIAHAFKRELKKRNITLHYVTRPADIDPISEVMLDSAFEAMDEVHSMMSRKKGLAGMAENVRQGWRAGGRAPVGYRLAHQATGGIRDGRPVTKSKLEPSEISHQVRAFLRGRARGVPRTVARNMAGLAMAENSLIDVEWNALVYAGHTVWNRHGDSGSGRKRRLREEWQVQRDTHPALITEREAETILAQLENSNMGAAIRRARAAASSFLLSGLVYSTDGRVWKGHGHHYRLRRSCDLPGRIVRASELDQAVIGTLQAFRTSDRYLAWLLELARRDEKPAEPGHDITAQIRRLERERQRAAEAAVASEAPGVYAQVVEQRSRQISALQRELAAVQRENAAESGLKTMGIEELRTVLESQDTTRVVRTLVDRVVLEPDLNCQIQLRRKSSPNELWRSVASPGLSEGETQGLILPVALAKRA